MHAARGSAVPANNEPMVLKSTDQVVGRRGPPWLSADQLQKKFRVKKIQLSSGQSDPLEKLFRSQ
jgi:hypothetical protein